MNNDKVTLQQVLDGNKDDIIQKFTSMPDQLHLGDRDGTEVLGLDNKLTDNNIAFGKLSNNTAAMDGSDGSQLCVECEDQPSNLLCVQCDDRFCNVCFQSVHRKGNRYRHTAKRLNDDSNLHQSQQLAQQNHQPVKVDAGVQQQLNGGDDDVVMADGVRDSSDGPVLTVSDVMSQAQQLIQNDAAVNEQMIERAKFIPLRLSLKERKVLRLLEAALNVSEYTDKIDVVGRSFNKADRIVHMIKDLCAILCGLVVASDYSTGQTLIADKDYKYNAKFFQKVFEVGRRHKIMNPDRMRDTYGKLVHLLMDSRSNEQVRELLEFDCVIDIVTVHSTLEQANALKLLQDPLVAIATKEISPDLYEIGSVTSSQQQSSSYSLRNSTGGIKLFGGSRKSRSSAASTSSEDEPQQAGQQQQQQSSNQSQQFIVRRKTRREIQNEIKQKENAIEVLSRRYSNDQINQEAIKQCLYSISDNSSYLGSNEAPIERMIQMLKMYFKPTEAKPSLSIQSGVNGARLGHSHQKQYYYVLQSLTLWKGITHNMFKLWYLAEQDLLELDNRYRLADTGQGLNRLQRSPRVSKEIHRILNSVMNQVGASNWVGSSVVHLGDTNVPNALVFIDKYTQVPRILNPVLSCLEKIDLELSKSKNVMSYIAKAHKSTYDLKVEILQDFFKHAFDGSGGDNSFNAGSCIDGRLTSAWNWTNTIEKKSYYPIFLLTGFVGFDGDF
ncbi:hypothetical protein MIR68_000177 [Amoeboaphelidium protococcarum]|nr:hypothetical protein MIR68_000177 [Amoeboaphelidium protococcarum]